MAKLRASKNESGFTLVEVMIVMAITSALVVIAFVGQRQLRSRAQFDAAVEKVVSTVSSAHTFSVAGVNLKGGGNGTTGCARGTAPSITNQYVFAGTSWTVDGTNPAKAVFQIDYYEALPGGAGANDSCIFDTQVISLPTTVAVTGGGSRLLFVRTNSGALNVCPVANLATPVLPSYRIGACAGGGSNITLTDADGHSALIQIDASGLAQRKN